MKGFIGFFIFLTLELNSGFLFPIYHYIRHASNALTIYCSECKLPSANTQHQYATYCHTSRSSSHGRMFWQKDCTNTFLPLEQAASRSTTLSITNKSGSSSHLTMRNLMVWNEYAHFIITKWDRVGFPWHSLAMQCNAMQCNAMQCSAVQDKTGQDRTGQCKLLHIHTS